MKNIENLFEKSDNEWNSVRNEIIDRISSLTIDCPECETIIYSDEQYQCGTCNGGATIYVLDWIKEELKILK